MMLEKCLMTDGAIFIQLNAPTLFQKFVNLLDCANDNDNDQVFL